MVEATWEQGLQDVLTQAAGVLRIHLVAQPDGPSLVAAAVAGDPYAAAILIAIADTGRSCQARARQHNPVLCMCCPKPIRSIPGVTFVIAVPDIDDPTRGAAAVICTACANAGDLNKRLETAYREIWPESRMIDIAPYSGTA